MARKRCEKTGSVIFVRHQDAAKVIGLSFVKGVAPGAQVPQSIYRCAFCGRWHVSAYTPEDTKASVRAFHRPARTAWRQRR
jgi:hypothetical protein